MDKRALWTISYGLYVVCSKSSDGKLNGQIANTVFQVTADPPKIAVCINKLNLTHELIQCDGHFSISILEEDTPMEFIGLFGFKSGRDLDKFKNCKFKMGKNSPIVVQHSLSFIEANVTEFLDVGSHILFVGEVTDAGVFKEGKPLTYATYHERKGKAPKSAPTYQEPSANINFVEKQEVNLKRYICNVCGYVYDPVKGDPDHGAPAGTPFEKLPEEWTCPICGASKADFSPE